MINVINTMSCVCQIHRSRWTL